MQKIIKNLSNELGINEKALIEIYKSYWKFIRCTIEEIDFNDIVTEDDYSLRRVNFNIPNIGKLGCSFNRMQNIKKQNKYKDEAKHKKDKANVQSDNMYNGEVH